MKFLKLLKKIPISINKTNSIASITIKLVDDLPFKSTSAGKIYSYMFPTSLFPRYTPPGDGNILRDIKFKEYDIGYDFQD